MKKLRYILMLTVIALISCLALTSCNVLDKGNEGGNNDGDKNPPDDPQITGEADELAELLGSTTARDIVDLAYSSAGGAGSYDALYDLELDALLQMTGEDEDARLVLKNGVFGVMIGQEGTWKLTASAHFVEDVIYSFTHGENSIKPSVEYFSQPTEEDIDMMVSELDQMIQYINFPKIDGSKLVKGEDGWYTVDKEYLKSVVAAIAVFAEQMGGNMGDVEEDIPNVEIGGYDEVVGVTGTSADVSDQIYSDDVTSDGVVGAPSVSDTVATLLDAAVLEIAFLYDGESITGVRLNVELGEEFFAMAGEGSGIPFTSIKAGFSATVGETEELNAYATIDMVEGEDLVMSLVSTGTATTANLTFSFLMPAALMGDSNGYYVADGKLDATLSLDLTDVYAKDVTVLDAAVSLEYINHAVLDETYTVEDAIATYDAQEFNYVATFKNDAEGVGQILFTDGTNSLTGTIKYELAELPNVFENDLKVIEKYDDISAELGEAYWALYEYVEDVMSKLPTIGDMNIKNPFLDNYVYYSFDESVFGFAFTARIYYDDVDAFNFEDFTIIFGEPNINGGSIIITKGEDGQYTFTAYTTPSAE